MSESLDTFLGELSRIDREMLGRDRLMACDQVALLCAALSQWDDAEDIAVAQRAASNRVFFFTPMAPITSGQVLRMLFAMRVIIGFEDELSCSAAVAAVMHDYLDHGDIDSAIGFLDVSHSIGVVAYPVGPPRDYVESEIERYRRFVNERGV